MSVAINPVQKHHGVRSNRPSASLPAEVWDVDSVGGNRRCAADVRTLNRDIRTHDALRSAAVRTPRDRSDSFEPRRENRESIFLGAFLAAALMIGSVFGGVLAGPEAASDEVSAHTTSDIAR